MRTVTLAEISRRVAPQSADQAQTVLDSAMREIQTELASGNTMELPYGLVMSVSNQLAAVGAGGGGGGVAVADPEPGAPALEMPTDEQIYNIMYAVAEKDFFTNITAQGLTGSRSKVVVVEGKDQALAHAGNTVPDLLIVDASMPQATDLIREIKANKNTSLVATILTYPDGTDPNRISGLKVCEDESLVEPFEFNELVQLAQSELARAIEERDFFLHEIHFQFQTSEQAIEEANELTGELLAQIEGMSEENCAAMGVAYREAVDNAARHGNKNQERKVIDTIYLVDQEKVTVTVEDEGDGFDTELYITRGKDGNAVARARQRAQEGRVGGLGIMLMLKCVDDLQYNTAGNQIRLTKFIR